MAFAVSLQSDPSMDYGLFQGRFYKAVQSNGFTDLTPNASSSPGDKFIPPEVAVPLTILWNPRRWYPHTSATAPSGFTNGTEGEFQWHHRLAKDASKPFICSTVFIDGRASFILIRTQANSFPDAESLRTVLEREFPSLKIKLQSYDA